jgi:glycosyltransferase involved in cell wall biosynthesis
MTVPVRTNASAPPPTSDADFTFLARVDYETGFARQNPLGVVAAFCAAFDSGAGPRLAIETAHAARYPAEHAGLIDAVAGRPDIAVVPDHAGRAEEALNGRSARNSCFVSLHRSEGTGLVLARAMAQGIPTIVTAHSFSAEMQDQRDSLLVPFSRRPIPRNEYRCEPGGSWAEPDLDAAARAMRLVFEQPTLAAARARRAQERARRQFSPSRSVRAMHNRVAAVDRLRYKDLTPRGVRPGNRLTSTV